MKRYTHERPIHQGGGGGRKPNRGGGGGRNPNRGGGGGGGGGGGSCPRVSPLSTAQCRCFTFVSDEGAKKPDPHVTFCLRPFLG